MQHLLCRRLIDPFAHHDYPLAVPTHPAMTVLHRKHTLVVTGLLETILSMPRPPGDEFRYPIAVEIPRILDNLVVRRRSIPPELNQLTDNNYFIFARKSPRLIKTLTPGPNCFISAPAHPC